MEKLILPEEVRQLDLSGRNFPNQHLYGTNCRFYCDGKLDRINMDGIHFNEIQAEKYEISMNEAELKKDFVICKSKLKALQIDDTTINGKLVCNYSRMEHLGLVNLSAESVEVEASRIGFLDAKSIDVKGDMLFTGSRLCDGVDFRNAEIGGCLGLPRSIVRGIDLSGASIGEMAFDNTYIRFFLFLNGTEIKSCESFTSLRVGGRFSYNANTKIPKQLFEYLHDTTKPRGR